MPWTRIMLNADPPQREPAAGQAQKPQPAGQPAPSPEYIGDDLQDVPEAVDAEDIEETWMRAGGGSPPRKKPQSEEQQKPPGEK